MQTADTVGAQGGGGGGGLDLDLGAALGRGLDRVEGWIEGFVDSLPNILAAVLIVVVFWILARLVRGVVAAALGRASHRRDLNRVVATMAYLAVLLFGTFLALGVLNLDKTVTTLLAGAGIVGLALGFAFKDIAENFIAGILMMLRRPFSDGDIIETADHLGTVEEINMRATEIRTFQGQLVIIPNSEVFKNPLTVWTDIGLRRVDLVVGVSYGDDLEKVRRVAMRAVEGIEARVRDREVELFYEEFGESSINFQVRFWIPFSRWPDFLRARSEAVMRIKAAFDENDITIPFPIRTLDFSRVGGATLAEAWPAK